MNTKKLPIHKRRIDKVSEVKEEHKNFILENNLQEKDNYEKMVLLITEYNTTSEKIFEPYTHLFKISISGGTREENEYNKFSINIPNGYKVFSVQPLPLKNDPITNYDIWFTNTKIVKVKPVYNSETKQYDYSAFGEVVSLEKEEKENKKLSKK